MRTVLLALSACLAVCLAAGDSALAGPWVYTNNGTLSLSGTTPANPAGDTSFMFNNYGTTNVLANATVGSTTASMPYGEIAAFQFTVNNGGDSTFGNGTTTYSGAVLNVGSATQNATLTISDVQSSLACYTGNTINVAAGSSIYLLPNVVSDTSNVFHDAQLYNWKGTINLSGSVQYAPNDPSGNWDDMLDNYGSFVVGGTGATLVRMPTPSPYGSTYHAPATVQMQNSVDTDGSGNTLFQGMVSGNGKLTYVNQTGSSLLNTATMINYGVIAPGTTAAPGTLELDNINLMFGSTAGTDSSALNIRLGGTAPGQFDVLTLGGGWLSFPSETHLVIDPINGFVPQPGESWRILNYASESGAFDHVTPGYAVTYYSNYAVLTAVPEPASLSMLLAALRRRGILAAEAGCGPDSAVNRQRSVGKG